MASRTAGAARGAPRAGTPKGIPASLIFAFARERRWPIVAGAMRKAGDDASRVEAQHHLQDQRRADGLLDRRVGADEEQLELAVGDPRGPKPAACSRRRREPTAGRVRRAAPPRRVDQVTPRHGEQPGIGTPGTPVRRPGREGPAIASPRASSAAVMSPAVRGQVGDQAAIGGPTTRRRCAGVIPRRRSPSGHRGRGSSGRTSTQAVVADGQRSAHCQRRIEVGDVDHEVAAELFLRVAVGAVLDHRAARPARDRGRGPRRLRPPAPVSTPLSVSAAM